MIHDRMAIWVIDIHFSLHKDPIINVMNYMWYALVVHYYASYV